MKKNTIDELFKNLEGSYDLHETPDGHERRFMNKLRAVEAAEEPVVRRLWWKPLAIAASIIVIFGIGFFMNGQSDSTMDLANISPELEQTQSFFDTAINEEIQKLKAFESPETKSMIDDAMSKINALDEEYQNLREDLTISGNDKRVIHAMIANLQSRIDLLEQVVAMAEDLNNLKSKEDEIII